jgi:hypothetical protein
MALDIAAMMFRCARAMKIGPILFVCGLIGSASSGMAENGATASYAKTIEPLLIKYCYDCHGDGMSNGKVAFDGHASPGDLVGDHKLWSVVLKNVRAGLMPPLEKPRPDASEIAELEKWIKRDAFDLDPKNPPAGRVTMRRLNRREYQNTIHDLMGIEFRTDEEFPPDDTGYGFDNIGDVLSLSPLLLEKYLKAAETIVSNAVPVVQWVVPSQEFSGRDFKRKDDAGNARRLSFYDEAKVERTITIAKPGTYRVQIELSVRGAFDFDPGRSRFGFSIDGQEKKSDEFKWDDGRRIAWSTEERWTPGKRLLAFDLKPLVSRDQKKSSVDMEVVSVRIEGPLEPEFRQRPENYDRFFSGESPSTPEERRTVARKVLLRFATKAFRRPVDPAFLDRLVNFAEGEYNAPERGFEGGLARAMVAVLASPRFLFRMEDTIRTRSSKGDPLVDEYSLASRLSYFLWSTMPDDELIGLADRGQLRKNLSGEVRRMMADERSREMVGNFVGQWLQVRDVEGVPINSRAILARDEGGSSGGRFRPRIELDRATRLAMRRETELAFDYVAKMDRSVVELLDANYTFLNETLATFYGLTNLNVKGDKMRLATLPEGSPRGGILTQGSILVVTSNPDRTSPVKRGLFILENLLGSPPPPPPANVPSLEAAEASVKDHEPTLREALELHQKSPLCHSCHSRMDPLGLAMENFNAMGLWRDQERHQPIESTGQLITGEKFSNISDLKRILATARRQDFYDCLTEKFLTFALGRGLEYYDVETVDQIVHRLEANEGRFSALLMGVIESAPFQRRQTAKLVAGARADRKPEVTSKQSPIHETDTASSR